jgi:MerR family transcriptional regulator, light-induced transcriptional regulator
MTLGEVNMSGAGNFDRQMLDAAFGEIEIIHKTLPNSALTELAQEVVQLVAQNLAPAPVVGRSWTEDEVEQLCQALLSEDAQIAIDLIERAVLDGASYDAICLSYLSAAAARMGTMWSDDQVSFYRVTLAAGRIYAILRILRLKRPTATVDYRRSAVFASVPGENHTLGISMAADLARDRGWDIDLFVGLSHDELLAELIKRKPIVLGLSAGGKRAVPALTKLIVAERISNPTGRILVCGPIASTNLNLVGVIGADAAAVDFETAMGHMERLLNLRPTVN